MSGRRGRRYRLRKRLRFLRWREEIRLACLQWAGMEFIYPHCQIGDPKNIRILVTRYEHP